jgi:hypothetical protein
MSYYLIRPALNARNLDWVDRFIIQGFYGCSVKPALFVGFLDEILGRHALIVWNGAIDASAMMRRP